MKRLLVALVPILLLFSCFSPPKIETFGPDTTSKLDAVWIDAIDFYSDNEFTKPLQHPYVDTARVEIRLIAKKYLPDYGLYLLEAPDQNGLIVALHVKIDACVQMSIFGVGLKFRARAFFNDKYLFEVVANDNCQPNYDEIRKKQDELGGKVVAAFAKKLGRDKK